MVVFELLYPNDNPSVSYERLKIDVVFDIKLDFARKAWLVADGYLTPDLVNGTNAGVVSRENV